jgi:hypothetical protein
MSEKIYACLLRLYPPAFRKRYGEETIQLLRDRLRDEPGCMRRLRLGIDLAIDIMRSLPLAYRNSYAEAANLDSITQPIANVPSFRMLHNEPIRRGTLMIAAMLTLTTLIAFGYVIELPIPSPAASSKGNQSPIERVLERLNRPVPHDSAALEPSSVDSKAASGTVRRAKSTEQSALPPPARVDSNSAAQTIEQAKPIPGARPIEAESPRSALPGPPIAQQRVAQQKVKTTPSGASSALPTQAKVLIVPPEGVSGRWIESPDAGEESEFPGGLILVQHDGALSGFGALSANDRYPILHGSVSGHSMKFELSDGRKRFLYSVKLNGEELRGTLTISSGNETRTAAVRLERAQ